MEPENDSPNLQIGYGVLPSDGRSGSTSIDNDSLESQQNNLNLNDEISSRHQGLQRDDNSIQGHTAELIMPKNKETVGSAEMNNKTGPLRLLDLPLDVLKDIIKEVTHTNDLVALALTHSALHNLATPRIYYQFDIVWPDPNLAAGPRTGVDALTYGLATLVMNEEMLGNNQPNRETMGRGYCEMCTCNDCNLAKSSKETVMPLTRQPRRGSYFSQHIRKFSIGNGPPEWVEQYFMTKGGGKMLGTLVALAIARMPNLETFIWESPSGILRDVWISLSSQGNRKKGSMPKLKKVWVRFHDNREVFPESDSPRLSAVTHLPYPPGLISSFTAPYPGSPFGRLNSFFRESFNRIEHPNLSVLAPLKSLSVLDIDELACLWETSILIGKSIHTLQELRIGMASYLSGPDGWASAKMTDYIGPMGVIGTIMAKMFTFHRTAISRTPRPSSPVRRPTSYVHDGLGRLRLLSNLKNTLFPARIMEAEYKSLMSTSPTTNLEHPDSLPNANLQISEADTLPFDILSLTHNAKEQGQPIREAAKNCQTDDISFSKDRLSLEILEIERVSLNVFILTRTIDWSVISSLTLLRCGGHEQLWKSLQWQYAPRLKSSEMPQRSSTQPKTSSEVSQLKSRRSSSDPHLPSYPVYQLNLKKIHTDAVSAPLISFLKETLAPNSLEWLFLQDGREYVSPVRLNSIHRGPIRHHRASLRKIMIDSAIGMPDLDCNEKRKKWMFNRELLEFITSGKMPRLKELAMSINYHDWHFFLQRLPQIPHLCSLYIPHIADHVYGADLNAMEFALQLVDVVAIRPEIQLHYVGLSNTCFELLEISNRNDPRYDPSITSVENLAGTAPVSGDSDDDSHGNNDGMNTSDNSDEDPDEKRYPVIKLREILFFDRKVSIFEARHGRL